MANPTSCYTCIHFQVLFDDLHERLLCELYPEGQRILDPTSDEFVAGAKYCAIHIVNQVIQPCREAHREAIRRERNQPSPESRPEIDNSERQIV